MDKYDMHTILKSILISMRPYQWYKNLIIFLGIMFSENLFNIYLWPRVFLTFALFCLMSGSVYIINDIKDIGKDQLHPRKMRRPIPSGLLPIKLAFITSISILFFIFISSFTVSVLLGYLLIIYLFLNILYTFYLKSFALIDVIIVAIGFVLRAIAGSVVINVEPSAWLILCVFLMALVLAFGKRRNELLIAFNTRSCLHQYNEKMLDIFLIISVTMLLMSYALYTFSVNVYMMGTLPFAFFGIFRFMQMVYLNNFGGEAELVLKDNASLANIIIWALSSVIILYWGIV